MGFFKRKEVFRLNEKDYGYVLSKMILASTDNCFSEIADDMDSPENALLNYLSLALRLTYICECLLKRKYSTSQSEQCIAYTISGLLHYTGIPEDKVPTIEKCLNGLYQLLRSEGYSIDDQRGLLDLAQSFQNHCQATPTASVQSALVLYFSEFIIYHTEDVIGQHLIMV